MLHVIASEAEDGNVVGFKWSRGRTDNRSVFMRFAAPTACAVRIWSDPTLQANMAEVLSISQYAATVPIA